MPIPLFTYGSATVAVAVFAAAVGSGRASADTTPLDPPPVGDVTAVRCEAVLDPDLLEIELKPNGQLKFVYPDDGVLTCNEWMVVYSYAGTGPVVDGHDPLVDQVAFRVAELEAAGPAGITVEPVLDPCWAALEVARDGDTLLWEQVIGDGCEMEITTDFAGAGFDTDIHVVQQSGTIMPPHMFAHDGDATTVLTGLPDGTWYVKVYEGAQPGTTMAVDGGAPQSVSIVHGVADGSSVLIHHPRRRSLAGDFLAP